ncbi:MAG: hypothetical protein RSA01_09805 [Clostridium sp.]|uniref:CD3072 family TudS-related putative desulfidase n=1 Tax=Clostridium sp. TaxID=1506 RepID=UPI002FC6AFC0
MKRGRKIVLLSHCILNCNAKVEGLSSYGAMKFRIIEKLHKMDIGIIQLPCPEMHIYGIKRWGHTKEQFDNMHYRKEARNILESIALQVKNYIDNGYKVIGIIGIDGSPSCGVNITCSGEWGGEFKCIDNYEKALNTLKVIEEKGVFMEEAEKLFNEMNINIPFTAIREEGVELSIDRLLLQEA